MGVLPLQFRAGESAASLGLTGEEVFDIGRPRRRPRCELAGATRLLKVTAKANDGTAKTFDAVCRIDTPQEVLYYRHGGILPYVLRQLAK